MEKGSGFPYEERRLGTAEEVVEALRDGDPDFPLLLKSFVLVADGPALMALRDELAVVALAVLPDFR
ncbi:hypothetical protein QF037_008921 [Streptomyces canus]|uniref:hypothetical protein n=1 Tax=Streptomyces canus TaxID=58343 RepID=UPI002784615C|nr:hypothetical protein [Streptomyces canus]MDQ0604576.1 hypothetical protein [Streptomyces canus]